jgi:tetratricopeptide (TPR) repeat protein
MLKVRIVNYANLIVSAFSMFLIFSISDHAMASDHAGYFFEGIKCYEQGNFEKAISLFSKIADSGVKNEKLFYNLGNAYLKNEQIGHAVLWYSRAEKLMPDDPDLKFNLNYAGTFLKDVPEQKTSPVFKVLFFWKYIFSPFTIQKIAIALNLIFWTVLLINSIRRKKAFNTISAVILFSAAIFVSLCFHNFYESRYQKYGVILSEQISVRSGLTENATELFVLHAGTKVRIQETNKDYFKICFSDDKIGWVKEKLISII